MARFNFDEQTRLSPSELAAAHHKWLSKVTIANPTAVTMTLKRRQQGRSVDVYAAQLAFRHFMRLLNAAAFGNAHRRYGRCLRVIPALEIMGDGRLHYHAVLERPAHLEAECYKDLIFSCLYKTDCVHQENKVVPVRDSGWLAYVIKPRSKAVADQIIDLGNLQIR